MTALCQLKCSRALNIKQFQEVVSYQHNAAVETNKRQALYWNTTDYTNQTEDIGNKGMPSVQACSNWRPAAVYSWDVDRLQTPYEKTHYAVCVRVFFSSPFPWIAIKHNTHSLFFLSHKMIQKWCSSFSRTTPDTSNKTIKSNNSILLSRKLVFRGKQIK